MKRMAALLFFSLAVLSAPVAGGPILSGVWYEFAFTNPGVGATGCSPADPAGPGCTPSSGTPTTFLDAPAWTIMLAAPAMLTVTDAFDSGDAFEVLDSGFPIGMTPFVPTGIDCGDDPVPCLANPGMSHSVFALAAGAHSFTIAPTAAPSAGAAYFIVSRSVPEPSTWLLVAVAALAVLVPSARRGNLFHL